ncbi:cuticle collagen 40-like [Falco naumanni]|uniref:cuticle collagen 40-like n=1 Tax=Falco naumanni TaxID=148594 RepID=UPI001ADE493F|nr:cuticle collagen 40-like [Falco naumanni]
MGQPRCRSGPGSARPPGPGPLFPSLRCRVKPLLRRCFFSCPFVPALRRPTVRSPAPSRANGARGAAPPPRERSAGGSGAASTGRPRRMQESFPVLRREKGSSRDISPEKLQRRRPGAPSSQSDGGSSPAPANLRAPGGGRGPRPRRAGRSSGGAADGLPPRRSATGAPLQRGQPGRTARRPHPPSHRRDLAAG